MKKHALVAFEDLDSDLDTPEESNVAEGSNNRILVKPNRLQNISSINLQVHDFNPLPEDRMFAPR